jgi:hypothetical protein
MFGTLVVPEPDEDFVFGLTDNEHDEFQSLYRLHVVPLKKIAGRIGMMGRWREIVRSDHHAYHAGDVQNRDRYSLSETRDYPTSVAETVDDRVSISSKAGFTILSAK